MRSFLFYRWNEFVGHAFLAKIVETGDKNRGDARDEHAVYFRR